LQIHLSTAVILMFVAGGMIWANTLRYSLLVPQYDPELKLNHCYGWPCHAMTYFADGLRTYKPIGYGYAESPIMYPHWHVYGILINAIVAVAILLCVAIACEVWIRRRERRSNGK